MLDKIREKALGRAVVMPVFGDAESLATVALCAEALTPKRVFCVHLDHGMLRHGEADKIKEYLKVLGIENAAFVKCELQFLTSSLMSADKKIIGPLSSVYIPSEKREIISFALDRFYKDAVKAFRASDLLVTGMHGIGGESIAAAPENAVEIAAAKGADRTLLGQPFPIQALAIRMLCHDSVIALTTEQREALCALVSKKNKNFSSKLVPLRTVGIRDGIRSYKSMAVLADKGVNTSFDSAFDIARGIDEELSYINRVACRVDQSEHASVFHCKPSHLCKEGFDILRAANKIVEEEFELTCAKQYFAVLVPIVADTDKHYSIVIRAVSTADFKSARALIPGEDFPLSVLENAVQRIKKTLRNDIDMVLYDITSKPPAAIEWE